MRRLLKAAPVVYLLYLLANTAVSAVCIYHGYVFAVSSPLVWLLLNLAAESAFTALCVLGRKKPSKPMKFIAQLLPLGAFLCFFTTRFLLDGVSILLIVFHGLLCFISCCILTLLYINPKIVRIISGVINGVLLIVLMYTSITMVIFTMVSLKYDNSTVIRQVPSPGKAYTAVLKSANQGVLGRYSLVDIEYDYSRINLGFGRFQKTVLLYSGAWNEYKTMRLEWEDDHTLLINEEAYAVDQGNAD